MKDKQIMEMEMEIEFEESSGNIFADLGLEDAEELYKKAQIRFHIFTAIEEKKLPEIEIAQLLGITQAEVIEIMNGHFSCFTIEELLEFHKKLQIENPSVNL